jgi:hypothetical protein
MNEKILEEIFNAGKEMPGRSGKEPRLAERIFFEMRRQRLCLGSREYVAEILGVHFVTIRRYVKQGDLTPIKLAPYGVFYDLGEVKRLQSYLQNLK